MNLKITLPAIACALVVGLIGCSNEDNFPTSRVLPPVSTANLDANAGSWRMIFLPAPNTFAVAAPDAVSSAAYQAELATVKGAQLNLTEDQSNNVKFWAGGGSLRWNEIMRGLAARFALPPAPLENGTYPAPSAANPFLDPQFPFANPPYTTRAYSYLTIAQFDALKVCWFYKFQFNRPSAAINDPAVKQLVPVGNLPAYPSEDGVLAGVSSAILAAMFPVATDEIARHSQSAQAFAVHSGKAVPSDVAAGFALGRAAAQQFLARARTDGFANAQGTPAALQAIVNQRVAAGEIPWISQDVPARPAQLPFFGNVTPWLCTTADIIANRPPAPPSTTSAAFRAELAAVKTAVENLSREQLATVYKWADGVGTYAPSGHWNLIATDFVKDAGFSEVRAARVFALLNAAEYDSIVACWDAKYLYFLPRPSQVDPSIKCHTGLPNFPAYTSGHSSFSAAAAAVLGRIFPAGQNFFNQQRDEAANSRLFGGIHYPMDCEFGKTNGARIAQFTLDFANSDGAN